MLPKKPILPYIALAAGILALGFSAIWVRLANAPATIMGMYRIGFAALFLLPAFAAEQRRSARLDRAALIFPLIGGIVTAADHTLFNLAIGYTTAANATLLNNISPLPVALVAWLFFKERLIGKFWLGLALTLSGGALVLGYDFFINPSLGWGDVIALISASFYAGYFLVTQLGRTRLSTLTYIWIVEVVACLSMFLVSVLFRQPLTGYPLKTYLAFIGGALVSQTIGYLSVGYALGHLPASMVAPTMIGQPLVTALISIPLLGEPLHLVQIVGGGIVLVGIYIVHKSREIAARSRLPDASQQVPAISDP